MMHPSGLRPLTEKELSVISGGANNSIVVTGSSPSNDWSSFDLSSLPGSYVDYSGGGQSPSTPPAISNPPSKTATTPSVPVGSGVSVAGQVFYTVGVTNPSIVGGGVRVTAKF